MEKEDAKVQQRSPITILSEYDGYLLEGDELTVKAKSGIGTYRECSNPEDITVRPKKKLIKVKAMEFSTVRHQGRTLKMLGYLAPRWRPKTRPKNKLRLNMKKLLNPRLNTKEVTVLDDDSSDEKPKNEKKAVLKTPVSHHTKVKNPLKSAEEIGLTDTKLSSVFLELRGELLKEEQQKETEFFDSKDCWDIGKT